jgi:hypothetical protein
MLKGQQAGQLKAEMNTTIQQHVFDKVTTGLNSFV